VYSKNSQETQAGDLGTVAGRSEREYLRNLGGSWEIWAGVFELSPTAHRVATLDRAFFYRVFCLEKTPGPEP
jgi:hypothetical protein